jgi:hypothetical protein
MQKAETSTIDAEIVTNKPVLTKLIDISIDEKNMVYVNWPIDKKEMCLIALCEALKLVSTHKVPEPIIHKPNVMDFIKGIKH